MQIRQARAEDAQAISALITRLVPLLTVRPDGQGSGKFLEFVAPTAIAAYVAAPNFRYAVAEDGSTLAGVVAVRDGTQLLDDGVEIYRGPVADAIVAGGTSADTKAHRPEVAALVREILMRQDAEGYALTCEALAKVQPADASKITCPTLLITGDEDGTAPPPRVKALTASISGAKMQILDRCGHWTTFERPAEVNTALLNFLLSI